MSDREQTQAQSLEAIANAIQELSTGGWLQVSVPEIDDAGKCIESGLESVADAIKELARAIRESSAL